MFKRLLQILVSAFAITTSSGHATTALELQKQADVLREEGCSLEAIDAYNQAIVHYQENKDYSKMMEALTGRLLSWKHLFYQTEDRIYAFFVKKEAEAMSEIAKEHQLLDKLHLIHFLNGTSAILLKDYPSAEKEFAQAVELYPSDHAEKGDWLAHLGEAIYRNGRKEEGKQKILQGVQKIEENSSQIDSFLHHVWVSGAYLRLAKLLKPDNREESQIFFRKSKKIIDSDERLVIRKRQLEAFMNESH
jgi:tetratricopeptide (TPR) repeat protein